MQKKIYFRLLYWLLFTLLMSVLLNEMFTAFWQAWIVSVFLLPSVVVLQIGLEQVKASVNGFKRFVQAFFWSVFTLYLSYMAILFGYWYLLELKADTFEMILVNPVFIWVSLGFFVGIENVLLKKNLKEEQKDRISIISNRRKTVLKIDQIAYVESRGEHTIVRLVTGLEYKNKIRISAWVEKLPSFVRIHRSFLVNPDFSVLHGSEVLVNEEWKLPVSRGFKSAVSEHFQSQSQ